MTARLIQQQQQQRLLHACNEGQWLLLDIAELCSALHAAGARVVHEQLTQTVA
jgi:hypothetical protein